MKDGIPLYRDSHHLSAASVMALENDLRSSLGAPTHSRKERQVKGVFRNVEQEK